MEHKNIKADVDSSNENWNTLYGQINEEWKYQEMLRNDNELDLDEVLYRIEHQKSSIAKYNEENNKLKDVIEAHKAVVKEFVTTKKHQEPKVENLNKEAEELRETYDDLKYKDKVLKDDPQLLSRLYKYLHEYQSISKIIKRLCTVVR